MLELANLFLEPAANVAIFTPGNTTFIQDVPGTAGLPNPAAGMASIDGDTGRVIYEPTANEIQAAAGLPGAINPVQMAFIAIDNNSCGCSEPFVITFNVPAADPCAGLSVTPYSGPGGCPGVFSGQGAYDAQTMDIELSGNHSGFTTPVIGPAACSQVPAGANSIGQGTLTQITSTSWRYSPIGDEEAGTVIGLCFLVTETSGAQNGCNKLLEVKLTMIDWCVDHQVDDFTVS